VIEITVRKNGPYLVKGAVELKDADGNPIDTGSRFATDPTREWVSTTVPVRHKGTEGGQMTQRFFRRVAGKSGLAPGTLVHIGEKPAEPVRITTIDFDAEHLEERSVPSVEECYPLRDSSTVTWINVDGVHEIDVIRKLGEHFALHPLLLEDIVHTNQRPKIEEFEDYVCIVLRMLSLKRGEAGGAVTLANEQISIVLAPHWVITFQERPGDAFDPLRQRIRENRGRVRRSGPDYLAYTLMDVVVDNYFTVLERFGDEIEGLEAELMERPGLETLGEIQRLKRVMIDVRRVVWPARDVISELLRGDVDRFEEPTLIFMRDAYDHAVRVVDLTETFREMVGGMHDLYLSQASNRMNEVMKLLTVIATVFIPLTFIVGVYGMNFDNMPELHWRFGYWYVWGAMVLAAIGLIFVFKRKHFL
jgi:magnesium transporter